MRNVGLPEFAVALARIYPANYRKVQEWAADDLLPTWPRKGRTRRYRVKIGDALKAFLMELGIPEASAIELVRVLSAPK
jgi:hypothetical protein